MKNEKYNSKRHLFCRRKQMVNRINIAIGRIVVRNTYKVVPDYIHLERF